MTLTTFCTSQAGLELHSPKKMLICKYYWLLMVFQNKEIGVMI